jgi:hypothetical protein
MGCGRSSFLAPGPLSSSPTRSIPYMCDVFWYIPTLAMTKASFINRAKNGSVRRNFPFVLLLKGCGNPDPLDRCKRRRCRTRRCKSRQYMIRWMKKSVQEAVAVTIAQAAILTEPHYRPQTITKKGELPLAFNTNRSVEHVECTK